MSMMCGVPTGREAPPARDAHGFDPDAYEWVPVPRAPRADSWTPERQRAFLGYLADIGRRFRQSDAMMMFLLRKHFPGRYGDNTRDRAGPAIAATAVLPPPVAEALDLLRPVPPANPTAISETP